MKNDTENTEEKLDFKKFLKVLPKFVLNLTAVIVGSFVALAFVSALGAVIYSWCENISKAVYNYL